MTCTECHSDTTLGSTTQIAANWTNDRCTDCHDTGAASTHDTYGSAHTASTAGGCAGSGASCHGSETNLAKLHDKSQSGGAPTGASCANAGCHTTSDTRPAKAWTGTDTCGSASSGCHTDKTPTNHGARHGFDIGANNYDNTTIAGCTNSGAGCHGSDVNGTSGTGNIVDYHPTGATTCLTGGCHTSADKATSTQPHTCAGCHDGTFENAIDTVALTDAAPAGHYASALHTAGGMSAAVSAGGSASAACSDCHSGTLYGQHQGVAGGDVTCADCHNANLNVTTVVSTSWPTASCAACHTTGTLTGFEQHGTTAPTVTASSTQGCANSGAGCHGTNDLHGIHQDAAAGCALSGCHDYGQQAFKPTDTTCGSGGACHNTYTTGSHFPAANHTATGMTTAIGSYQQGNACEDCHSALLTDTHTATSAGTISCSTGGTGNTGCHNQSTPIDALGQVTANWPAKDCAACHTTSHDAYSAGTHSATMGTAGTADGCATAGCHNTTDVRTIHDRVKPTAGCTASGTDSNGWTGGCHSIDKPMTTTAMSCGSGSGGCHTNHTNNNHMPQHDASNATSQGCANCHETLTVTTIHAGVGDGCNVCHGGGGYTDIHTTAASFECVSCHNGTLVGTHSYDPYDPTPLHAGHKPAHRSAVPRPASTTPAATPARSATASR